MAVVPVRLGIVGMGRGFMLSLSALLEHPNLRIVAGTDPREDARAAFASRFGCSVYLTLDAMLEDPDVEAIYIASPHEFHAAQTIAAAHAGKHVLVEKPMAISVRDCQAMARAAKRANVALLVGPSHGFDRQVERAREIISSHAYGAVRMVTAMNFTDFLYRLRRPEELDSRKGGGVVFSQAAHQLDVVCRLLGGPVRSIRATTGAWDPARPSEGAYNAFATFDHGATATLTYSGYAHYDTDELVDWVSETGFPKDPGAYGDARRKLKNLNGADEAQAKIGRGFSQAASMNAPPKAPFHEHFGFVLVSCEQADLRLTPQGIWIYADGERSFEPLLPPDPPRAGAFDALVGAIRGGGLVAHDADWGTHITACCEALLKSSELGREIFLETSDHGEIE